MAFNFNWSPLIADTSRARDMLTSALNRSPKPPIIVDDIIVTELNLGQVPPELEILEIGDLAEDRFRGIFKMSYTGDAYLTLKTRVQANPLNTYLSTKPSFASPQPLAAASSLTIPLSITLSDFRLSGFVILVFSRQKGITTVFRNDPLESLKVSSTFDSIPFVRDYLQKEIEAQLRTLFMEDLPAIIHRLSLRVFSPDQVTRDEERAKEEKNSSNDPPIDPLASPPQDPCDAFGRPLDETELSALSPDHETEMHATFSQKNLLRLAALTDSHRTLSLFTPPIRDAVFRAWAGAAERGDVGGTSTPTFALASLSRPSAPATSATSSLYSASVDGSLSRRASLATSHTTYGSTQLNMAGGKSRAGQRKRRNRVVNLRRSAGEASTTSDDGGSVSGSATSYGSRRSSLAPSSSNDAAYSSFDSREDELQTPPRSPEQTKRTPVHLRQSADMRDDNVHSPRTQFASSRRLQELMTLEEDNEPTPRQRPLSFVTAAESAPSVASSSSPAAKQPNNKRQSLAAVQESVPSYISDKKVSPSASRSASRPTEWMQRSSTGSILEQAWMVKMANEIARKVHDEKAARGFWNGNGEEEEEEEEGMCRQPPPAYAA